MKTQRMIQRSRYGMVALGAAIVLTLMIGLLGGCTQANDSETNEAASENTSSVAGQAPEGYMTIPLTLKQDVTSPEAQDSPIQFAEEDVDMLAPEGSSALDVLKGVDREIETTGSGDNVEVISIGGLENGAVGIGSRWIYTVNGQEQEASPAVVILNDGDTMVWTFVRE